MRADCLRVLFPHSLFLVCEAVSIEFYMLFMIEYDSSCTLRTPVKLKSGTKCRIIKGKQAKPSAIIFPKESTKLVWFLFAFFLFMKKRELGCSSNALPRFIEYEQLCQRNNGLAHFNASLRWQSQSLLAANKRFILPLCIPPVLLTFVYILLFYSIFGLEFSPPQFLVRRTFILRSFMQMSMVKKLTFFPQWKLLLLLGMNMNTGTDCSWMVKCVCVCYVCSVPESQLKEQTIQLLIAIRRFTNFFNAIVLCHFF